MGAQYYLDPFEVQMPSAQSGLAKYEQKSNCYVIRYPATELRQIPSNATLIIDGHSALGSATLSRFQFDDGKGHQSINFATLAALIAGAHLPRSHVLIRLLACEGCSYACSLAGALGELRYDDIAVGGYTTTNVQVPGQHTRFGVDHYDADDNLIGPKPILWYGSRGQKLAAKPDARQRQTQWPNL